MKKNLFIFAFLFLSKVAFAQTDITSGLWYNDEKTSKIQFYKQNNKVYGKIVWLKEPNENGKPRIDKLNPSDKLKARPLMGLVFLTNFTQENNSLWSGGEIYDPKSGKTYSSKMTLLSPKQIELRGYIGIPAFGRSSMLTRAE